MPKRPSRETILALVSDVHYGKKTPSFGLREAEKRLNRWMDRILRIKELLGNGYVFDELCIAFLGDINDGTDIYATQPHHQAETNVLAQAEMVANIFARLITQALECFPRVHVIGVAGNHGRSGRHAHEAANWDIACYKFMQHILKPHKVTFNIQTKSDFALVAPVRHHRFLFYHGHYIRFYMQVPWYGIVNKVLRWAQSVTPAGWKTACFGHFHTCGYMHLSNMDLFLNGTLITDDEYALLTIGLTSSNKWWLVGVSDKHPTTFKFDLDLT